MNEHEMDDERLRTLIRAAAPAPPAAEVDWSALHARIMTRGRPLLRRTPAWWQLLAGWSSKGIPAAAAAAAIAALLLGTVLRPGVDNGPAFVAIEEELAADLDGALPVFIAGADDEVLDALLFYDGEDR